MPALRNLRPQIRPTSTTVENAVQWGNPQWQLYFHFFGLVDRSSRDPQNATEPHVLAPGLLMAYHQGLEAWVPYDPSESPTEGGTIHGILNQAASLLNGYDTQGVAQYADHWDGCLLWGGPVKIKALRTVDGPVDELPNRPQIIDRLRELHFKPDIDLADSSTQFPSNMSVRITISDTSFRGAFMLDDIDVQTSISDTAFSTTDPVFSFDPDYLDVATAMSDTSFTFTPPAQFDPNDMAVAVAIGDTSFTFIPQNAFAPQRMDVAITMSDVTFIYEFRPNSMNVTTDISDTGFTHTPPAQFDPADMVVATSMTEPTFTKNPWALEDVGVATTISDISFSTTDPVFSFDPNDMAVSVGISDTTFTFTPGGPSDWGEFDGIDDYVDTQDPLGQPATYELTGWFRTTQTQNAVIFDARDAIEDGLLLQLNANGTLRAEHSLDNVTTTGVYNDGQWHSFTLEWDGATFSLTVDTETVTQATNAALNLDQIMRMGARSFGAAADFYAGSLSQITVLTT